MALFHGDTMLVTDLMGRVSYTNLMTEEMTGWLCEKVPGQPLSELVHPMP